MAEIRNWSFKDLSSFLKDYGFICENIEGSHHYYVGRIEGKDRLVQAILSVKERDSQSLKTMKLAIRHSGIPKGHFNEWRNRRAIHKEIIG